MKKMSIAASACIALIACPLSANAAISVYGNSLAKICYVAAQGTISDTVALEACTNAIEQMPLSVHDRAATYINRGILRARLGQPDLALDDYNHGLSLDGDLGEGYVDRGAVEISQRQFDTALADINKGISLNANELEIAYYDRAVVDEAMGNIKAAYYDYKKAVELQPTFQLANQQLTRFRVVHKGSDGT